LHPPILTTKRLKYLSSLDHRCCCSCFHHRCCWRERRRK